MTSPPAASYCPLVDQPSAQQLVLYNRAIPGPVEFPPTSIWVWQGSNWIEVVNPTLADRVDPLFAYDGVNILLYGGQNNYSFTTDQETFDGHNWSVSTATLPPPRTRATGTYIASLDEVVMAFGESQNMQLNETWVFHRGTQIWKHVHVPQPPWRTESPMASDGVNVLLFGGLPGVGLPVLGDVWNFVSGVWVQLTTTNVPPPRAGHGFIYDQVRGLYTLFGGYNGNGMYFNDTWEFNLTTLFWRQLEPNLSPTPRAGISMCWDSTRKNTVVWGGIDGSGTVYKDTFLWNGQNYLPVQGI
jgi:galactose oxidase-like protein